MEVPLSHSTEALGAYYDGLSRWTAFARHFGYGGGRRTLTVHRALADPRSGGRPTSTRLHDVLAETLPTLSLTRVLDAGCGLGGTLLDLAGRTTATLTGITLSATQAAIGRSAVAAAGLTERVAIEVRSYDTPPEGPFDLALAIESLAHSQSPAASLHALASRLAPGGSIAIVDDMPEAAARTTRDLDTLQRCWRLPVLCGSAELAAALTSCGLTIVADRDLTAELRPRTTARIRLLEAANRFAHGLVPTSGLRAVLDSHLGGLALERLYRHSLMRYRLVVATKRHQ